MGAGAAAGGRDAAGNAGLGVVGQRRAILQIVLRILAKGFAYVNSHRATGGIAVDEKLRTSVKGVYAAGDCTGVQQFTHYAGFQGGIAARNALLPLSSDSFFVLSPEYTPLLSRNTESSTITKYPNSAPADCPPFERNSER